MPTRRIVRTLELSHPGDTIDDMRDQQIRVLYHDDEFYAHENLAEGEVYVLFEPTIEHEDYKKKFAACDIDPRSEVIHSGFDEFLGKEFVLLAVVK